MVEPQSNPSAAYAVVRDELITALAELDETQAAQRVPSCPEWTVKDVAAHLCGLNAELIAEVQGGLGSDEATTRQVGDRSTADLGAVLDEWKSHAGPVDERMTQNEAMGTALTADLVIHVYDLVEVLDQPTTQAAAATPLSAHRYVPLLQQRAAEDAGVALSVELTDGTTWPADTTDAAATALTVRTSPHNFLRGVTGRLTRASVEAFEWSADPTDLLDRAWNQYGPFRV